MKIKSTENPYIDGSILYGRRLRTIADNTIIDGGAFNGDAVRMFVERIGVGNSLNIHCYEPSPLLYDIIEKNIHCGKWEPHNIFLHKAALWDEERNIGFEGDGLSGHVNENGTVQLRTEKNR